MKKYLNSIICGLLVAAGAVSAQSTTTNLLESVSVRMTVYTEGTPKVTGSGTRDVISAYAFTDKQLIQALKADGTFNVGDILVRVTPVPNYVTNLSPVSTNYLTITNESTNFGVVGNFFIYDNGTPEFIGDTNLAFGTNLAVIDGANVTLGTNSVTVGQGAAIGTNSGSSLSNPLVVGTNTTVTMVTLTNAAGQIDGTNYFIVNNALVPSVLVNQPGPASWAIYNRNSVPKLTALPTNILFDIHTDHLYDGGTNYAYVVAQNMDNAERVLSGSTQEVRSLIFSNSTWNIRLQGDATGHLRVIDTGEGNYAYPKAYNWTGNGSGTTTNATPVVVKASINEAFYQILRQ